ncbi:alpha/beta hydrolase-fold protein [Providencia burhodogranariea]|uniref:Esterase n=1 Tax=Providencia burhodogranariea DSM 19968 TaxID=1141662 RepID=K8W6A3_9GAMM|nr:alpha/beta hydrolase-fold protein [Providencia burhodogranariea]EKT55361.1 esterase [Providencia burhodogranariea DSM 19968]
MKSLPLLGCILFSFAAIATQPDCIRLDELSSFVEGIHDSEGHSCLLVEISDKHYIRQEGEGISDAALISIDKKPLRVLLQKASPQEPHTLSYIVPTTGQYYVDLKGVPDQKWQLKFNLTEYQPIAIEAEHKLDSPKLQALLDTYQNEKNTDAFWREIKAQGTPLIEDFKKGQKKVTFLWRGAKANAYILGAPSGNHETMAHIPNTDIWYRSFVVPNDTLSQYKIAPDIPKVAEGGFAQRRAILATAQADPFNSHAIPSFFADQYNRFSLLSLAPEKRQCDFAKIERYQLKGQLDSFTFHSEILDNDRKIYIYRPNVEMKQPALLVLLDGQTYLHTYKMADFFDKWMDEGAIPPMYVVFLDSISANRRADELPPNPQFPQMLAEELMPILAKKGIHAPAQSTIIAGSSYGGLGATWNALEHPELFGNVISMSGSYWWAPKGKDPEWLISEIEQMSKKPLRFYLEAGLFEQYGSWGGIIQNHYRLLDVLKHKKYQVEANELPSGHDYVSWCETLYEGTRYLTSEPMTQ